MIEEIYIKVSFCFTIKTDNGENSSYSWDPWGCVSIAYLGAHTPALTSHCLPQVFLEGSSPAARIIHSLTKPLPKVLEDKLRLILTVEKFGGREDEGGNHQVRNHPFLIRTMRFTKNTQDTSSSPYTLTQSSQVGLLSSKPSVSESQHYSHIWNSGTQSLKTEKDFPFTSPLQMPVFYFITSIISIQEVSAQSSEICFKLNPSCDSQSYSRGHVNVLDHTRSQLCNSRGKKAMNKSSVQVVGDGSYQSTNEESRRNPWSGAKCKGGEFSPS